MLGCFKDISSKFLELTCVSGGHVGVLDVDIERGLDVPPILLQYKRALVLQV